MLNIKLHRENYIYYENARNIFKEDKEEYHIQDTNKNVSWYNYITKLYSGWSTSCLTKLYTLSFKIIFKVYVFLREYEIWYYKILKVYTKQILIIRELY